MRKGTMRIVVMLSLVFGLFMLGGCGGGGGSSDGGGSSSSAPSTPSGLKATAGGGQVSLSWNAATDATSYNLYYRISSGVTTANGTKMSATGTSSTHTGRTNGTPYYYIVTAVNSYGESAVSSEVSATPFTGGATDTNVPSSTTGTNFINSGASSTSSSEITLSISATDDVGVSAYYVAESSSKPSASESDWVSVATTTSYSADVSFTLSGGSGTKTVYVWFKDDAGNVSSSKSDSISVSDVAPPTVSATSPENNATGAALTNSITATFSEDMTSSTITTATFYITGVLGTVTYSGTTAYFTPSSDLAFNTTYTATITTGVKDSAGNAMAGNYTWSFKTTSSGTLDTTFGTDGKVTTDFVGGNIYYPALAIQSDGKIVAGGYNYLVRFNTDGSLGASFGTGGVVTTDSSPISALAIQSDGKIVAGGSDLIRYNTDGSLDTTFGTGGIITIDFYVAGLAIQSDGKIVIAGTSSSDFAVARYKTDGSIDTTFGTGGKVTTDFASSTDHVEGLAIQSDGKIVVVGYYYYDCCWSNEFAVVRYNTDGSIDSTFGGGKITTTLGSYTNEARAVAIQDDGKIVVAGDYENYIYGSGSDRRFVVVRYNTDSSLDTTFGGDGIVTNSSPDSGANNLAIQSDGKIVIVSSYSDTYSYDFGLFRYNTDGSLDSTFGTGGYVTTDFANDDDYVYAVAVQSDGKIVAAGYSTDADGNSAFAVVRYLP